MSLNNKFLYRAGIALFSLLVLLPFAAGIIYAAGYATGLTGLLSKGFTLHPFYEVLHDGEVLWSVLYSIYITIASIIPALLISLLIIVICKDSLVKQKAAFLLYLPLSIPAIVAAFVSFQLLGKSGFFSRLAYHAHVVTDLQQFPDLINDRFGMGIIITHILMATPFFLIYFSNLYHLERVNDLSAIAATLGASSTQSVRNIMIPVLWKKAKPTVLLYGIFVLGSYEIPLILGRQSPQMLSVLIVQKAQRYNLMDIPKAYCIALLSVLLISSFLFLFLRSTKNISE